MTTGEYSPLLRSGNTRSGGTQHHLPIHSHYFDITDIESWPIAGLLVLLDGQGQPVRAELHLYDNLEPHVQEAAIRQARLVLQERYAGGAPVPVRLLETFQVREEMVVRLPPAGARPLTVPALPVQWRPYALIGAGALVLLLMFWIGFALLGGGDGGEESVAVANTPDAASQSAAQEVSEQANGSAGAIDNTTGGDGATNATNAAPASGADLPLSRNARGDLGIGMRVRAVPGLRVALRSEPSADRGITLGELAGDDVATIAAGPQYTQGDSDTIVWWFVELANGTQAWAAANTSQQTLLMPAQ